LLRLLELSVDDAAVFDAISAHGIKNETVALTSMEHRFLGIDV